MKWKYKPGTLFVSEPACRPRLLRVVRHYYPQGFDDDELFFNLWGPEYVCKCVLTGDLGFLRERSIDKMNETNSTKTKVALHIAAWLISAAKTLMRNAGGPE